MNADENEAIIKMVGAVGRDDLIAISHLLSKDSSYKDKPFLLACHLLYLGIEKMKEIVDAGIRAFDAAVETEK